MTRIDRRVTIVVVIAFALICGACGDLDGEPAEQSPRTQPSETSGANDAGTCPELTATSVPVDLRPADRLVDRSGPNRAGVRVLFRGQSGRELSLLSGVSGELPRGSAIERATIRNHEASLSSPSQGVLVARWLEAAEGAPCSQYAVVASKLSRVEMESVLAGIR